MTFEYVCASVPLNILTQTPLVVDSSYIADVKRHLRDKVIGWDGLARVDTILSDQADLIKILETQSPENKQHTVQAQLLLYSNTLLSLLNKLKPASDDVLKKILVLINDLLLDIPEHQFIDSLLSLSSVDESLPYDPFLKHLSHEDSLIKILSAYNLTILLSKAGGLKSVDKEVIIRVFDVVLTQLIASADQNTQSIGVQLLLELAANKSFRSIYAENNVVSNFKAVSALVASAAKLPNTSNQLYYNTLLATWILSFHAGVNKSVVHNFPDLIGNLLTVAKDSIKLKIVRVSVSTLKNLISVLVLTSEQFKTIKLLLFHDGLSIIKTLQERKFASNGSDEELASDLAYLSDELTEIVATKLTSLDEYLTELENPELNSFTSPTHKSSEFWLENAGKFKDSNYKLVKKILSILESTSLTSTKAVLLNDIQYLINNLGQDLVQFINTDKDGAHKLAIMSFLENYDGDNELKYEALKTIQLLVGHSY